MANQPPYGPYPSYYLPESSFPPYFHPPPPHGYPPPPGHLPPPPPGHLPPPPPSYPGHPPPPPPHGYPYYFPGAVMIPVPVSTSQPGDTSNPTYITNYIYHGAAEAPSPAPVPAIQESEAAKVEEFTGEYQWVPATSTTASFLNERAVTGGHEGWDGSPLWVIRSWHGGELLPGKLSVRHNLATIPFQDKEVTVQDIEVLCAKAEDVKWVPASNGNVPPGAIPGGRTASGETLYVGRARLSRDRYVEDLSVEKIEELLERRGLEEFKEFVRDRDIDGRKLLNVTEGIVKLWRPRINAKKFIMFVEELKTDPGIHLVSQESNNSLETNDTKIDVRIASEYDEESVFQHYKNVGMTRIREINFLTTVSSVEEILKKIVPAKSFLYRNQKAKTERINSSYVPMEGTSTKKSKTKLFRLSSYEYPFFDLSKFKYFTSETKTCSFNDRGYYSVQKENENTTDEKVYKIPIQRSRSRSLATADELYSIPERRIFEDHFYEDLCYSDVNSDSKARLRSYSTAKEFGSMLRSSYTSKIQGIFNSLKLPSIFKGGTEKKSKDIGSFEASSDMYDSIHLTDAGDEPSQIGRFEVSKVEVEDYLEPVHWSKDYCDIIYKDKEPSLVSAIRRMFEYNFRFRKAGLTRYPKTECLYTTFLLSLT
ncbi:hypothetical protein EVAR_19814_1 [Eumeta japonica]|uniref:Uncharacterized protein n=1 Tax=Eumeta variegata TaxID=151549 RepID=A0A4C1US18_EUMVA|nr:hypothetical protein EVAR_19814_1 [Eumeta japonica]